MGQHIQKSLRIQQTAEDASLTITAPGVGKYNCLESIAVESSAAADVTITSGGKSYKVAIGAGGGFEKVWPENSPWIGAENSVTFASLMRKVMVDGLPAPSLNFSSGEPVVNAVDLLT